MCKIYKLIIVKFTNGCLIHRLKLNFTHYMVNFTCTQNMLIVHNSMYNLRRVIFIRLSVKKKVSCATYTFSYVTNHF